MEAINNHEKQFHQHEMFAFVDGRLKEHESSCLARQDMQDIKNAVTWLVVKQGGNPKDVGL